MNGGEQTDYDALKALAEQIEAASFPKQPFTPAEREIMDQLVQAHNKFLQLDGHHPSDKHEWVSALHQLQSILMCRVTARDYPNYFTQGVTEPFTSKAEEGTPMADVEQVIAETELKSLVEDNQCDDKIKNNAMLFLKLLPAIGYTLPSFRCHYTTDGRIVIQWSRGHNYISVEIGKVAMRCYSNIQRSPFIEVNCTFEEIGIPEQLVNALQQWYRDIFYKVQYGKG